MSHTISAPDLRSKVARIIEKAGSTPAEADQVADNLVMANLSGHDSHGVGMVPRYVDAVLEGGLSPNTGVKVLLDSGALLSLDGQRGYGQITGVQAMTLGIERARQHGSCIVALGNFDGFHRGHQAVAGEAIAWAVARAAEAGAGSTVLVAGKGHETGQEVAGVVHPFEDRAQLVAALRSVTGTDQRG